MHKIQRLPQFHLARAARLGFALSLLTRLSQGGRKALRSKAFRGIGGITGLRAKPCIRVQCNEELEVESAVKPGSVVDSHSSRPDVAVRLKQPTRERRGPRHAPLFGLAPGGVCHATRRCPRARCALTAPFQPYLIPCGPSAVCFLLHFPSAHAAQVLPGTLPCGARTFLGTLADDATAWPTPWPL